VLNLVAAESADACTPITGLVRDESTRDPARFAFAHGGKDGTPYAVDRETYDRTIETMNRALAGVERSERVAAPKRLSKLAA
jgi:hypothetical protein